MRLRECDCNTKPTAPRASKYSLSGAFHETSFTKCFPLVAVDHDLRIWAAPIRSQDRTSPRRPDGRAFAVRREVLGGNATANWTDLKPRRSPPGGRVNVGRLSAYLSLAQLRAAEDAEAIIPHPPTSAAIGAASAAILEYVLSRRHRGNRGRRSTPRKRQRHGPAPSMRTSPPAKRSAAQPRRESSRTRQATWSD